MRRTLEKYSNAKRAALSLSSSLRTTDKGFLALVPSMSYDVKQINGKREGTSEQPTSASRDNSMYLHVPIVVVSLIRDCHLALHDRVGNALSKGTETRG